MDTVIEHGQHDLGREWQRRRHGPRRDSAVVGTSSENNVFKNLCVLMNVMPLLCAIAIRVNSGAPAHRFKLAGIDDKISA